MDTIFRLLAFAFLAVGFVGCGGNSGPQDERFNQTLAPDIQLANDVRGSVNDLEPGSDLAAIGAQLAETLGEEMGNPSVESHEETYQKILDAANALAGGDTSKLQEIKALADSLPK